MCGTGDFAALAVCAGRLAITLAAVAGIAVAYRFFRASDDCKEAGTGVIAPIDI
jgi:hypothetical protein